MGENAKGAGKGRKHASDSDGPWLHDKYFELVEEPERVSYAEWRGTQQLSHTKQSTSGTQPLWNHDVNWSDPNEWGADEWSEVSRGWSEPQMDAKQSGSHWDGTSWWDSTDPVDSWNEWSSADTW